MRFACITPVGVKDGPEQRFRCPCGHEFWVDACDEENLYLSTHNERVLRPQCPQCGLRETPMEKPLRDLLVDVKNLLSTLEGSAEDNARMDEMQQRVETVLKLETDRT